MIERPRRLTDMWSIRIDFSLGVSLQKYLIFHPFGGGGMKSLNPWETKTDAPSNVQFRKIRKWVHLNRSIITFVPTVITFLMWGCSVP